MSRFRTGPIVVLSTLLCIPAVGYAASILKSADNFALLGGTKISSTGVDGTTIMNGNIGLFPNATNEITGFPPAVVTGGAILITGDVTGQGRLDLITAANGLAGMPSNVNMSNVDLGGTTLPPGVYTFSDEATLNGALTLDAQGRNNVFWVFQIATMFTTSVNSSVTVINPGTNGGSDDGIFWYAGSAIIIGANNQIEGNYLSGTSITFGNSTSGNGRALALAAVTLDKNTINVTGGPAGSDWTGGLKYDQSGNVVPTNLDECAKFLGTATAANQLYRLDASPNFLWSEGTGYLYDGYWPFVYDFGGEQWLYVYCSGADENGYYLYNFKRSEFGFTGVTYYPFYWAFLDQSYFVQFGKK